MALLRDNAKQQTPAFVQGADPWKSDQDKWEFVSIPDEDVLGNPYPSIGLNSHVFEPGKTYKLPSQVADYVKDRLKAYNRSCTRLLSPKRDLDAERRVATGTAPAGITAVDPSTMGAGNGMKAYTVS